MPTHTPLSPAVERVQHFINVWTFMKPKTDDIQSLELGHPSRESNLTVSDLQELLELAKEDGAKRLDEALRPYGWERKDEILERILDNQRRVEIETVEIGGRKYVTYKGIKALLDAADTSQGVDAEPFTPQDERTFIALFKGIQNLVHENARAKGWWDEDRSEAVLIALEHAELSEALEALRHGNPPSNHIPEFTGAEEELADVVIRIMDHAAAKGHRLAEAIIAKMAFNAGRDHRHGGKAF